MEDFKYSNREIFTVPEGYFEQLNKEILNATVKSRTNAPRRKNVIIGAFGRFMGYAAAVAILFVLATNIIAPSGIDSYIAETDENEYIDNILNSYAIDDYTFYCYLTNTDFE